MAYRNGTYIAFHANGARTPGTSDLDYYRLLTAWAAHKDIEFKFVDSHEKNAAIRDGSKQETLRARLRDRLNNSKQMVLVIGDTTFMDDDWVPFEITHAVDRCGLPIIAAYTGIRARITSAESLRPWWPNALRERIDNYSARVIHVPFRQRPLLAAIERFTLSDLPAGALTTWSVEIYNMWGI